MFDKEAIQELAQAQAIDAAQQPLADPGGLAALPNDFCIHDLEKYLQRRRRPRGTMTTSSVVDFAAYTLAHAEEGATAFINTQTMAAVAVLNLGGPEAPGHADNRAVLAPKTTAAYNALTSRVLVNGSGVRQTDAAEFLEDWADFIRCEDTDGSGIPLPKAVAAVRNITIEALRKGENREQSLSAERSTFESVKASSRDPLPYRIHFTTAPYVDLMPRTFSIRFGILTGSDKPMITLRMVNHEKHAEDMAAELAVLVRNALQGSLPVLVGAYKAEV